MNSTQSTPPLPPEGVTPEAWAAIGAVWNEIEWRIPERNAQGEVVGTARRFADGQKGFVAGGKRGLVMAWPLPPYAGTSTGDPVVVCEGPSDTAAGIGLGLTCLGKPSATCGNDLAAELLADRHVMVMADNDSAGGLGADGLVKRLARAASVRRVFPPAGIKDLRAWVVSGATRETVLDAYRVAAPEVIAPDSIRPPKGIGGERIELVPVRIDQLGPAVPPDWIWNGYVARGATTLFTGLWKAGKSTLVGCLLHDLAEGGGLVQQPSAVRVLVLSEEPEAMWARRREELKIGNHVDICARPLKFRPNLKQWHEVVEELIRLVTLNGYGLVVIDTLAQFWGVPDENSASEVGNAVTHIHALTATGVAVMLLHHPRKSGGDIASSSRGSGALPGYADILVEFGRCPGGHEADTRRILRTNSRYSESPPEAVVEFTGGRYTMLGAPAATQQADRMGVLASILHEGGEGLTADEVVTAWPGACKPGKTAIVNDLNAGAQAGTWTRSGTGRKGNPYRYLAGPKCDSTASHPLGGGIESAQSAGAAGGGH